MVTQWNRCEFSRPRGRVMGEGHRTQNDTLYGVLCLCRAKSGYQGSPGYEF